MNNQTNFASKATDRTTDVWLTPRSILDPLGEFDLDPCAAPVPEKWPTAKAHFTEIEDGLKQPWHGRCYLNPPYSDATVWLKKLADHGNGIALVFARTETKGFFSEVWNRADGLLFIKGRLSFLMWDGFSVLKGGTAGAPSVLIAYGLENAALLCDVAHHKIPGKYIPLMPGKCSPKALDENPPQKTVGDRVGLLQDSFALEACGH